MATQVQAQITTALSELGLEQVPPDNPKIMGGPQRLKVTQATLAKLTVGKRFEVASDGTIANYEYPRKGARWSTLLASVRFRR